MAAESDTRRPCIVEVLMAERITHLDTTRGVAVMGILVMNSVAFAFGDVAYFDISRPQPTWALDAVAGILGEVFADQKFMGVFSMLFGASLVLFLERVSTRTSTPVRLSVWRNALLFGIGLLHSMAWDGDVLMVYALCAPVLLLLRRLPSHIQVGLGFTVFSLSLVSAWLMGGVDDTAIRSMWTGSFEHPQEQWAGLLLVVDLMSRSLGMMLIGMGLYSNGFLNRPLPQRGLSISLGAIVIGALLSSVGQFWVAGQAFDARIIMRANVLNGLATIPIALGYLGLCMAWDHRSNGRWLGRVRCLGRMALTNYLGQTAISLCLVALVPGPWISRSTVWVAIAGVWLIQLLASEAWLKAFRMGPAEWLWRCATYRQFEPFRR